MEKDYSLACDYALDALNLEASSCDV